LDATKRVNILHVGTNPPPQEAAILILSHGKNRRGAYKLDPASDKDRQNNNLCTSAQPFDEACNSDDNLQFVVGQTGDTFDDHLLYLSRNALVSYLGAPTCATGW